MNNSNLKVDDGGCWRHERRAGTTGDPGRHRRPRPDAARVHHLTPDPLPDERVSLSGRTAGAARPLPDMDPSRERSPGDAHRRSRVGRAPPAPHRQRQATASARRRARAAHRDRDRRRAVLTGSSGTKEVEERLNRWGSAELKLGSDLRRRRRTPWSVSSVSDPPEE